MSHSSPSSKTLFAPLDAHVSALDSFLRAQVDTFEPSVRPLADYTFSHRGKRLRPSLVFFSGWNDTAENGTAPAKELIRAGAIVELVHLATLVHDDILDDATLRHNSQTVPAKYGPHTAVLLGDALFAHALVLAAEFPTTDVCRWVAGATRQVCSGEITQTFARNDTALTLENYFRIIRLKTAELFEVSCRLGAHIAFGEKNYTESAAIFGRHLGIAYQIFDDIADFAGDEARIGKTLGTDLASGKFTLPVLLSLCKKNGTDAEKFTEKLRAKKMTPAELIAGLRAENIPGECRRIFLDEISKAENALAAHTEKPSVPFLNTLAAYIRAQIEKLNF